MATTFTNSQITSMDKKNLNGDNLDNGYSSRTGQSQRIRQYQSGSADAPAFVPRSIPEFVLDAPVPGLRETLGDVRRKGDCTRKAEAPPTEQPQAQQHLQRRQPRRRANRLDHTGDENNSDSDGENSPQKNQGEDDGKQYDQNPHRIMNERAFAQNTMQAIQTRSLRGGQISR